MKTKSDISGDSFMINFLNSRKFVFTLLGIVILYMISDELIINLPKWVFGVMFLISAAIIVAVFLWRYAKYNGYYRQLLNNKLNIAALVVVIIFCSAFLQLFMNVGIDFFLVQMSKTNSKEIYDCKIDNIQTSNRYSDKVGFVFRGQVSSGKINTRDYKNSDLIANFMVRIWVRKSLFGSYYLQKVQLVRKNDPPF